MLREFFLFFLGGKLKVFFIKFLRRESRGGKTSVSESNFFGQYIRYKRSKGVGGFKVFLKWVSESISVVK